MKKIQRIGGRALLFFTSYILIYVGLFIFLSYIPACPGPELTNAPCERMPHGLIQLLEMSANKWTLRLGFFILFSAVILLLRKSKTDLVTPLATFGIFLLVLHTLVNLIFTSETVPL